jgi:hypothetical protein
VLAARITLPGFSVSSATNFPKSAGKPGKAVPPKSAMRARRHPLPNAEIDAGEYSSVCSRFDDVIAPARSFCQNLNP